MRDDDVRAGSEAAEAVWRGSAAQSPVISERLTAVYCRPSITMLSGYISMSPAM